MKTPKWKTGTPPKGATIAILLEHVLFPTIKVGYYDERYDCWYFSSGGEIQVEEIKKWYLIPDCPG